MVEVNSETDFVAKNDEFLALVNGSAEAGCEQNPADVAALSALPMGEGTVESTRAALVGKIGENMAIRRFVRIQAEGKVASPTYTAVPRSACWSMSVGGDETLAKDLAMHIAASKPKSLDSSGGSSRPDRCGARVAIEKAARSRQADAMIEEDRAEGSVQKFLKEVTLLGQPFVKAEDGKQTIEQLLKAKSARIASFTLYVVGEGIEKKTWTFAAEVAAQAAAAQGCHAEGNCMTVAYRRILLKLSGEALMGNDDYGISRDHRPHRCGSRWSVPWAWRWGW
jgi:elongation factor Ts